MKTVNYSKNVLFSSILSLALIACGGGNDSPTPDPGAGNPGTNPGTGNPGNGNPGPLVDGIEFSSARYQVSETGATAAITVRRNGDASIPVSVNYDIDINASTATADLDYTKVQGTLTWVANDSLDKTFYIPIKPDIFNDPDETVSLTLQAVNNALLATNDIATLTIQDASCSGILDRNISVDTVITEACTIVTQSITVDSNAKLTINPGVSLIFQANTGFNIRSGSYLNANGTISQPILFTGESATPGFWRGIQFTGSNDLNNVFNYVTVEYGGSGYNGNANVNLFGRGSSVAITNSTLSHSSGYGFQSYYSGAINDFSNNTFHANKFNPIEISQDFIGILDTDSDYSGNGIDSIKVVSTTADDTVSTTQTWQALNVPYSVGNINIGSLAQNASETILTIMPGTILKFRPNSRFTITRNGTIIAKGSAAANILFTADNANPLTGYWDGVTFYDSNTNNIFDYVTVEYGGGNNNNANIYLFNLSVTFSMSNSISRFSSGYGLRVIQSGGVRFPKFLNNEFTSNELAPIRIPVRNVDIMNSSIKLTGNVFDEIIVDTQSTSPSVTTPLTWPMAEVFYSVNRLNINSALTIEPGVEIRMRNDALTGRIAVDNGGSLNAVGTAALPIIIRGVESPIAGYWEGIRFFQSTSVNNNLQYVTISDAGILGSANLGYGIITVSLNSVATIENCTIADSETHGIGVLTSNGGALNGDQTTNTFININTGGGYVDIFNF